jgi:hypothetical protein
LRARLPFPD